MAGMRGEEVLKLGYAEWMGAVMRVLITIKIIERDFYGASYLIERVSLLGIGTADLSECVTFVKGVVLLMKKKTAEGLTKLLEVDEMLSELRGDEFTQQIKRVYHLYLIYAYFLLGEPL